MESTGNFLKNCLAGFVDTLFNYTFIVLITKCHLKL